MRRFLREEDGFTLSEVLVTMILMTLVMFALYAIFDMSIRVFSFGNDKVEAAENARIGLAKMEREIRAAYPQNKADENETLFRTGTGDDTIIFGNDENGNRIVDDGEIIEYELRSEDATLRRNSSAAIEFVESLQFEYLNEFGGPANYDAARMVKITLVINKDGRSQTLSTDVALRNRSA